MRPSRNRPRRWARSWIFLLVPFLLCLWAGNARAAEFPYNLTPGETWQSASRTWGKASGVTARELPSDKPQSYRRGLIESGMLSMLNRAGAKHELLKEEGKGVTFVLLDRAGLKVTLAFSGGRLQAVLVVRTVTPDTSTGGKSNPFSRNRLAPIRNHLKLLGRSCRLSPEDKGPNHFKYAGRCGRHKGYVEYRPEDDEFRELFHL